MAHANGSGQGGERQLFQAVSPLLPMWQYGTPHPLCGWPEGHLPYQRS